MDSLLQKGGTGKRARANLEDATQLCPICNELIDIGQRLSFTHSNAPVHVYKCLKFYYAALYLYYGLSVTLMISALGLDVRKAYRIQRLARQILSGELKNVPGRNSSIGAANSL